MYHLFYEIGANDPYSCGTSVFEIVGKGTKEIRVINDCGVEGRAGGGRTHGRPQDQDSSGS
jgi:hypothetical protein